MWQPTAGPAWGWEILLALALASVLTGLLGFVHLIVWPPECPSRQDFEDY